MTDEDKRQQKAMLLLEYQETQDTLAHLREKAGRMSAPFSQIGIWLEHAQITQGDSPREAKDRERNSEIRDNADKYCKELDFDAALTLMNEIRDIARKLQELAQRKADLGLK